MATTFTLKRKTFSDEEKKGMSTGKKALIGGTLATAAAAALAARGAGGFGNLASRMGKAYNAGVQGGGGMMSGVGSVLKSYGSSIAKGAKAMPGDVKNLGGKITNMFKGAGQASAATPPPAV